MAVSHVFSNTLADWTGTVTIFNSQASTVTASATALVRPADWNSAHNQFYTLSGNTNNASTASGTNVVFQGVGAVTLAGSTATLNISVAAEVTYKGYAPFDEAVNALGRQGQGTLHFMPFYFPNIQHDRILLRIHHSNATNSTGSLTLSNWVGLYTRNVSTLSLLSSTSSSIGITFHGTVSSWSQFGQFRLVSIPWTNTITQGDYWVGIVSRTTSGGTDATLSQILMSQNASNFSGLFGAGSNATAQRRLGQGVYTTSTAGIPASVGFSQINGTDSQCHRPPLFFFLSQTA